MVPILSPDKPQTLSSSTSSLGRYECLLLDTIISKYPFIFILVSWFFFVLLSSNSEKKKKELFSNIVKLGWDWWKFNAWPFPKCVYLLMKEDYRRQILTQSRRLGCGGITTLVNEGGSRIGDGPFKDPQVKHFQRTLDFSPPEDSLCYAG